MRIRELLEDIETDVSKLKERAQVKQLRNLIEDLEKKNQGKPPIIKLGGEYLELNPGLAALTHLGGVDKTDITLNGVDPKTKQDKTFYISLKWSKAGFRWGQVAELSTKFESFRQFMDDVKTASDGIMLLTGEAYYQLAEPSSWPYIMYGANYGEEPGLNNVDAVWIGEIVVKDLGNVYELGGNQVVYLNGDAPQSDDRPVLLARKYRKELDASKRNINNGGVVNCIMEFVRSRALSPLYIKLGTKDLAAQAKEQTTDNRINRGINPLKINKDAYLTPRQKQNLEKNQRDYERRQQARKDLEQQEKKKENLRPSVETSINAFLNLVKGTPKLTRDQMDSAVNKILDGPKRLSLLDLLRYNINVTPKVHQLGIDNWLTQLYIDKDTGELKRVRA